MRKLALLALACLLIGAIGRHAMTNSSDAQLPVRTVRVTMAKGTLNGMTNQLHRFADANGFTFQMGQTAPDPERVVVEMLREDVKVIGVNASDTGAADITFAIFLYRNGDGSAPEQIFDDAAVKLSKTLSEAEGVISVSTEKK
jgi:hypothetical protein